METIAETTTDPNAENGDLQCLARKYIYSSIPGLGWEGDVERI